MSTEQTLPMSLEELARLSRMDATPIDFDDLISRGILKKHGAWYQIIKIEELPDHAKRKISAIRTGPPAMVKFRAATKAAAAQAKKLEAQLAEQDDAEDDALAAHADKILADARSGKVKRVSEAEVDAKLIAAGLLDA